MTRQWWDEIPAQHTPNLNEQIVGSTFTLDDEQSYENNNAERTVADVIDTSVGVDSTGFFVAVTVTDTDGGQFELFSDGTVCNDERVVGRHSIGRKAVAA